VSFLNQVLDNKIVCTIMPKVTDPEIIDLVKAINEGKVDMTQGHESLLCQFPWLEARFISDPDYAKNFRSFWRAMRAHYKKTKGN
jgi:hypothetical protein